MANLVAIDFMNLGTVSGTSDTDQVQIEQNSGGTIVTRRATVAQLRSQLVSAGDNVRITGSGTINATAPVWRNTSGAPASTLGNYGDYDVDITTGNYYQKGASAWTQLGTLRGAAGNNPRGAWNAATNSPALSNGGVGGAAGDLFFVSAAGSTSLDGNSTWQPLDLVINTGPHWVRVALSSLLGTMSLQNSGSVAITGGSAVLNTATVTALTDGGGGVTSALVPLLGLFWGIADPSGRVAVGVTSSGQFQAANASFLTMASGTATFATATVGSLSATSLTVAGTSTQTSAFLGGTYAWGIADPSGNLAIAVDTSGVLHGQGASVGTLTAGSAALTSATIGSLTTGSFSEGGATTASAPFMGGPYVWGLADTAGDLSIAIDTAGVFHGGKAAFNILNAGTATFGTLAVTTFNAAALDIGDSVASTVSFMGGPYVWGLADTAGDLSIAIDPSGNLKVSSGVFTNLTAQNATISNFTIGSLTVGSFSVVSPAWASGYVWGVQDPSGNVPFGVGNDGKVGVRNLVVDNLDSIQSATNPGTVRGLLQAAKRGPRRKIAIIGSSHEGTNGNLVGGTNLLMDGAITMLNVLARQAFTFDIVNGFWEAGGTGTNFILQNIPAIIAYQPDFLFTTASPLNDAPHMTLAQYEANLVSIYDQLLSAGIMPVVMSGWPLDIDNAEPLTLAERRSFILATDDWKRNFCIKYGLPFWDVGTPSRNLSATGGGFAANMSADGLHPAYLAGYVTALQGMKDLAAIIPPGTTALIKTPIDTYDPVWNPDGSIITNGLFWTSGGSVTSPATGTAPGSWTWAGGGGGAIGNTVAVSLQSAIDGIGQWAQLAISGTSTGGGTGERTVLSQIILPGASTYQSGDILEAWIEINVLANSPFSGIAFTVTDHDGVTNWETSSSALVSNAPQAPSAAWGGVIYCPPITIKPYAGSGTQALTISVAVIYDGTSGSFSGTVQFRCPTIRKNTFTS